MDIIIGTHAIRAALANPHRRDFELFVTEPSWSEFKKIAHDREDIQKVILKKHDFQKKAQEIYRRAGFEYKKIAGGALLRCSSLDIKTPRDLYSICELQEQVKIVILDGITDVHNAGAIVRTASFYGVDILLLGGTGTFRMTPAFYRIASGGAEHLQIIQAGNLSRTVRKIQELGVVVFALSEGAQEEMVRDSFPRVGVILGAENQGISHALLRQCEKKRLLRAVGPTTSLNVSVATAVALERLFGV